MQKHRAQELCARLNSEATGYVGDVVMVEFKYHPDYPTAIRALRSAMLDN